MSEIVIGDSLGKGFNYKLKHGMFNNIQSGAINWSIRENIKCLQKPKISFAFFCYDLIKQRGEKWLRESFEAMKGQSDDIMVIDYGGKDGIDKISKEYGFRYFDTPKTKGIKYHMSKCNNNAVYHAKHKIFVRLTQDIVFPSNFAWYISSFFKINNPKKTYLLFKFFDVKKDGRIIGRPGWIQTFYTPYLKKCRGWDERTSYFTQEDRYGRYVMKILFDCEEFIPPFYFLAHRHHITRNENKQTKNEVDRILGGINAKDFIKKLKQNLWKRKKYVRNSYW